MRFNRIIVAISCGAGLALVGACSDGGSSLTAPSGRAPGASLSTSPDTFWTPQPKVQTSTAPDTFWTPQPKVQAAATVDTFWTPQPKIKAAAVPDTFWTPQPK